MKVLDTAVAIDHLRGAEPARDLLRQLIAGDEEIAASEVVRFELLAGVREGELEFLEDFSSALTWLPVSEHVARAAGALAGRFRPSHAGIDDVDYLIAATALLLEADLLTTNVRHFPMLEGLRSAY
ncbi:MAG: type II toxin-antitoxin system VapC family toxin [Actinobacteria bacterium]|nr:type II toxin-antitoxin system VapC family toxin [Actinomycetota bacterium]